LGRGFSHKICAGREKSVANLRRGIAPGVGVGSMAIQAKKLARRTAIKQQTNKATSKQTTNK